MKGLFKIRRKMDKGSIIMLMEMFMQDNGKIINFMEKDIIFLLQVKDMKESFNLAKDLVKAHIHI